MPLIPGLNHFMRILLPKYFLRNLVHASDIRFRGRCQAPANLGTEAEKVVAAVGIARHVWTLADHEPNVNLVGVVRICRYKRLSLCRGKPTVPENTRGTLTSTDCNSAHTLIFTIILYKSCTIATFKHLGLLPPINYVRIIAFKLNS